MRVGDRSNPQEVDRELASPGIGERTRIRDRVDDFEWGSAGRGLYLMSLLLLIKFGRLVGLDVSDGTSPLGPVVATMGALIAWIGVLVPESPDRVRVLEDPHNGEIVTIKPDHAFAGVPLRIVAPVMAVAAVFAWTTHLAN
tara:strand:- start:16958 stop:17380 length:423 start_codon:yes stop_codon:yes gene_type:complete